MPVNALDECPGPSLPHPCPFGSIYPRPVAWFSCKYLVGPWLWPHLCGALNCQFHQSSISYLRTDAVSPADWQQIGHLRRTGRDPAQT